MGGGISIEAGSMEMVFWEVSSLEVGLMEAGPVRNCVVRR